MSQVELSRVGHSAVSSPPTLWQCQTSRPPPILLVLLLIREPASQELEGGKEEAWVFTWKRAMEIVTQSKTGGRTMKFLCSDSWHSVCRSINISTRSSLWLISPAKLMMLGKKNLPKFVQDHFARGAFSMIRNQIIFEPGSWAKLSHCSDLSQLPFWFLTLHKIKWKSNNLFLEWIKVTVTTIWIKCCLTVSALCRATEDIQCRCFS